MRSGSPGTRNNCTALISEAVNSPNPKDHLKQAFKNDMKKLGFHNELKTLKNFKRCLQSRSQEQMTTIQHEEEVKAKTSEEPLQDYGLTLT